MIRLLTVGSVVPEWGGRTTGGVATFHTGLLREVLSGHRDAEVVGVVPTNARSVARLPDRCHGIDPVGVANTREGFQRAVQERRPDVVVLQHITHRYATWAAEGLSCPTLGIVHSWHSMTFADDATAARNRQRIVQNMQGLDGLVFPSEHARREGRGLGFEYPCPTWVVHNSINDVFWEAPTSPRRSGVVFVGAVTGRKRPLAVVRAAAAVGEPLTVIGEGDLEGDVGALAQRLGVPVRMLGRLAPAAVAEELGAARALCVPSLSESFGLVYVEAAACRTPVVGFSATLGEIEGAAGARLGVGVGAEQDEQAVTEALSEVLGRDWGDLRAAVTGFRSDRVVDRYVATFREVCGEGGDREGDGPPTSSALSSVGSVPGDREGLHVSAMVQRVRGFVRRTGLHLKWFGRGLLGLLLLVAVIALVVGVNSSSLAVVAVGLLGVALIVPAAVAFELVRTRRALQRTRSDLAREKRRLQQARRNLDRVARDRPGRAELHRVASEAADNPMTAVRELRSEVVRQADVEDAIGAARRDVERLTGLSVANSMVPDGGLSPQVEVELVALGVRGLLASEMTIEAWRFAEEFGARHLVDVPTLRTLVLQLRGRGYLEAAVRAGDLLIGETDSENDVAMVERIRGDVAVLSGEAELEVRGSRLARTRADRVLFVVGNALPDKQSGYTIRTHAIARSLRDRGVDVHVVTQLGWPVVDSPVEPLVEVDGVPYHRLAGPWRNEVGPEEWAQRNAAALADLAGQLEPRVLHAASDFFNARAALAVGQRLGIPVIYESRGFWEETWLSRMADRYGWADLEELEARVGLPDVYRWRREAEDDARRRAQHVVTLDSVMADRIKTGGVNRGRISVVPNAVDPDDFPVLHERDPDLAQRLDIERDAVVIGYISSLVEYEGIDLLIEAFRFIEKRTEQPLVLLIVGDGPERDNLEALADELGTERAIFTGRVPHTDVLRYYSMIDIFVVPRRPVEVCHLVTPLKPFEAFATGRCLLMADVRALQGIADDSGAAVTFRAGRVPALVNALRELIDDPERRRELGRRGASWVRGTRTWDHNADRYLDLYATFDLRPDADEEVPDDALMEVARAHAEDQPLRPVEDIGGMPNQSATTILREGWVRGEHPRVQITPDIDWLTACMQHRSWNFYLHAWDFMEPVLRDLDEVPGALRWCTEVAATWCDAFADGESHGTQAWYDMAVGQRAYRFAYLVDVLLRLDEPPAELPLLLRGLRRHAVELLDDSIFKMNNHGVYVALGGIAMARRFPHLPRMAEVETTSRQRLHRVATGQFAADGGHREHSPDYHRMLLDTLSSALDDELVVDDDVRTRLEQAQGVLAWFIRPDGRMVQLGDSPQRDMRGVRGAAADPHTVFQMSGGTEGEADPRVQFVLPATGYAFVRDPAPTGPGDIGDASYVALAATFHSRTHKHADDATIVWFARGHELLVDSGRYGYGELLAADDPKRLEGFYYAAPERQYVESTRAHNTVEVDGRDHQRRDREPYGSGIVDADVRDGVHRLRAAVPHDGWRHERVVVHQPNHWLLVHDDLHFDDQAEHDVVAWWNLPADLELIEQTDRAVGFTVPTSDVPLWIVVLGGAEVVPPARAELDPRRGWRSRVDQEFEPAWSVGCRVSGAGAARVRTLLAFSEQVPTGTPVHPFEQDAP